MLQWNPLGILTRSFTKNQTNFNKYYFNILNGDLKEDTKSTLPNLQVILTCYTKEWKSWKEERKEKQWLAQAKKRAARTEHGGTPCNVSTGEAEQWNPVSKQKRLWRGSVGKSFCYAIMNEDLHLGPNSYVKIQVEIQLHVKSSAVGVRTLWSISQHSQMDGMRSVWEFIYSFLGMEWVPAVYQLTAELLDHTADKAGTHSAGRVPGRVESLQGESSYSFKSWPD